MAWLFLPSGLLMPAAVPEKADPAFTDDGRFDIQVRGRVESHLSNFIRDYMVPMNLEYSEIEITPQMDYNVRFYTTKDQFAQAVQAAMLDIDYLKFKPTAERKGADGKLLYKDGVKYHDTLNSIWGTVTRLGSPGGKWRYNEGSGKYKGFTGSTFLGKYADDVNEYFDGSDMDYTPSSEEEIIDLLAELDGIPVDQWDEFCTPRELDLLQPYMKDVRREEKRLAKREARRFRKERLRFKKNV